MPFIWEPPRLRDYKVASRHFLDRAATPPNLGGEFKLTSLQLASLQLTFLQVTSLRALDLANRVDRFLLAFIIGAGQHLADETEGYELNPADDQEGSGKQ